jgi:hypothetical protein
LAIAIAIIEPHAFDTFITDISHIDIAAIAIIDIDYFRHFIIFIITPPHIHNAISD